jgi:hypothetical protein
VEHAEALPTPFPWRAATVVVGAVAAVELIALLAIGLAQLAPGRSEPVRTPTPTPHRVAVTAPRPKPVAQHPLQPRTAVRVLVLNGNGVSGAAAAAASSLQSHGYRIADATNAQRSDYANSMVMFVPGWIKEARRLARDAGIRMVAPVDGLRPAQLKGSTVILLLGS